MKKERTSEPFSFLYTYYTMKTAEIQDWYRDIQDAIISFREYARLLRYVQDRDKRTCVPPVIPGERKRRACC